MAGQRGKVKVKLEQVDKRFQTEQGTIDVLAGVTLDILENDFVTVVGPSGCGKSTLLNIIAGLTPATAGQVICDGQQVTGISPERGVVFQQYALFPWLTVAKNVSFGLEVQGKASEDIERLTAKYLQMVGLTDFAQQFPKVLSGGMKQRVALARAYAAQPSVLLMDEPFGALDPLTRSQLQEDLVKLWQKEKITCFFITHDIDEAIFLGTKVVIMGANPGRIKEVVPIPLPSERDLALKNSPDFLALKTYIWSQVYGETHHDK